MDDVLNFLKSRRSVRLFLDKTVPREELEKLVDAARFAPTARNVQPWEFILVTDREKLNKLAELWQNAQFMARAAACIAVFSKETNYFLEDGSAATCNILLAATALGIGSCWIAGDKKPYAEQVGTLLAVPQGYRLISMIALGYPQNKEIFKSAEKRPLKELIHWEKF